MIAADYRDEFYVQKLLKYGADVNHTNNYGDTALHMANSESVAKILVENGAYIDVKDNQGNTPFDRARIDKR